jgi:LacI family transcriptional regulator
MRRHGLPSTVGEGEFRLDRARMAMLDLLDTHVGLDGVVVANNLMTIGVLDALRERGRIVPDEVAIVSIDDPPWSALVAPSLTTLGQPTQRMASRAFELLMDRIEGRRTAVRHEIFHFELHVRDSSGVRAGQAGTARTERAGS